MKGEKQDISLRQLFRKKLENSEIIPGESVKKELMRKLAGKEFLRFNPSRFNIYYLTGLIVIGITAAILISSDTDSQKKSPVAPPSETIKSADTVSLNIVKEPLLNQKSINSDNESRKPGEKVTGTEKSIYSDLKLPEVKMIKNNDNVSVSDISDSLSRISIVSGKQSGLINKQSLKEIIGDSFEASAITGCAPMNIKFRNNSSAYDSCRWNFGDGGFSKEINPSWIFDMEGEYKVTLIVFRANGTETISSTVITVHPKPVARFEFNPEKPIIPEDEIHFINYSMDAVKYKWEFGDGNTSESIEPDHKYKYYGKFDVRLMVWSEYGCADSLRLVNAFQHSGNFINFPNAFIPNPGGPAGGLYSTKSDEAAQIFHPVCSGVSDYQLRIFSKRNMLVFESNDVNIGWDGYFKGQLCESGVYVWKVRGYYINGEPFVKVGDVTLLKY